jgi:ABC-type phosphate transport system substrate-binding protein
MKAILTCLLLVLGMASMPVHADDVVVVVNAAKMTTLTRADVRNIFLGRTKTFPDGTPATPVVLKEGSHVREVFNQEVLKKDETQLRAYWVELIFTGRALPPQEVGTEEELRNLVAQNPGYIGYLSSHMLNGNIKTALP